MNPATEQQRIEQAFPQVGRWVITAFPPGWMFVPGFGIRQMPVGQSRVMANVGLGEDAAGGLPLAEYIGKQTQMMEQHLKDAKVAGPQVTAFAGAEEALLLMVRHAPPSAESMLHVQIYIRVGDWVGIVTLTAAETQVREVRPAYDYFVKGLRIRAGAAQ